jgi:hypothetical protein
MERKSVEVEAGLIHAESVNELDRSREFESAIMMLSSMPSKYNPPPTFPMARSGPLINVPLFPLPEESHAVLPVPSSNFQYPTRLESVPLAGLVGVEDTVDETASVRLLGAAGASVEHCEYASDSLKINERNTINTPTEMPFNFSFTRFPDLDK